MSKSHNISHKALKNWSKIALDAKPDIDGETLKIDFSFKAGGHYPIECLLLAQEPIGMLTVTGSAYLAIPNHKTEDVLEFCQKNSGASGLFNVIDGALVFIHSRSADTNLDGKQLIDAMVAEMNKAITSVAEGVLEILKE